MERLTVADDILENGKRRCYLIDGREVRNHAMEFYWRLKEYEDLGLTPERIEAMQQHNHILIEQLSEYQRLEEQGLLLKLPCKVGDIVYLVDTCLKCIHHFEITEIRINKCESLLKIKYAGTEQQFIHWQIETMFSRLGEWFFKTKEEAEAKLKEIQNETHNGK